MSLRGGLTSCPVPLDMHIRISASLIRAVELSSASPSTEFLNPRMKSLLLYSINSWIRSLTGRVDVEKGLILNPRSPFRLGHLATQARLSSLPRSSGALHLAQQT